MTIKIAANINLVMLALNAVTTVKNRRLENRLALAVMMSLEKRRLSKRLWHAMTNLKKTLPSICPSKTL